MCGNTNRFIGYWMLFMYRLRQNTVWKSCLNYTICRIMFWLGYSCASELSNLFTSEDNSLGAPQIFQPICNFKSVWHFIFRLFIYSAEKPNCADRMRLCMESTLHIILTLWQACFTTMKVKICQKYHFFGVENHHQFCCQ